MKIILFKTPLSYCDFMCQSLSDADNVTVIEHFDITKHFFKRVKKKILKTIGRKPYNRYLKKLYLGSSLTVDDQTCFVMFDSTSPMVFELFSAMKEQEPDCMNVLLIYNSIQNNNEKADYFNKNYDMQFTFDPYDAKKYGWFHFMGLMPTMIPPNDQEKIYDFAFFGLDKGRYQDLKDIYTYLSDQGYSCYFYVVSDIMPADETDKKIIRKERLGFNEIIEIEKKSKCVLDYTNVEGEKQGLSLRVLEAIYCNSKILTNNLYTQEVDTIKENSLLLSSFKNKEILDPFLSTPPNYILSDEFGFKPIIAQISRSYTVNQPSGNDGK